VNAAGNYDLADDHRDDRPPPIENIAAQGQPQDLRNNVMDYYNMAYPPQALPAVSDVYSWGIHFCP